MTDQPTVTVSEVEPLAFTVGCDPWPVGPCPATDEVDPNYAWATMAAQDLLWATSGRQFGVCRVTQTIRVARGGGCAFPWEMQAAILGPHVLPGLMVGVMPHWRCCAVRLSGPVRSVTEVRLDGVAQTGWVLDGDDLLTTDGSCWPGDSDCSPPGLEVDYEHGVAPPSIAALAMAEVTSELLKACAGDPSCRLPARVVSLSRQGVTMAMLDPQEYLTAGRLGLPLSDWFITTTNPAGLIMPSRVVSPDYQ